MLSKRKITLGNLILDLSVSPSISGLLNRALEFTDNPGLLIKKNSVKVFLYALGDAELSKNMPASAKMFLRSFLKSGRKKLLSKRQIKCLSDAFKYWGRSGRLLSFFKNLKKNDFKNMIVYPIDSAKLIILDIKRKTAHILLSRDKNQREHMNFLNFSLLFVISIMAPIASSFVLHSSCLQMDKRGYLFIGDSGAGKTTIAKIILRNKAYSRLVADDNVLISFEKGRFNAYRLPFYNKRYSCKSPLRKTRVDKVFLLNQYSSPALRKVDLKTALVDILSNHSINSNWTKGTVHDKLIVVVSRFTGKHMPDKLFFRKDNSFLSLIC